MHCEIFQLSLFIWVEIQERLSSIENFLSTRKITWPHKSWLSALKLDTVGIIIWSYYQIHPTVPIFICKLWFFYIFLHIIAYMYNLHLCITHFLLITLWTDDTVTPQSADPIILLDCLCLKRICIFRLHCKCWFHSVFEFVLS